MNCVECQHPFRWEAAGQKGNMQVWYHYFEQGPNGKRCLDRDACHRRAAELQPTLFDA